MESKSVGDSETLAEQVRSTIQYLYPVTLLLLFLLVGAVHTIRTARRKEEVIIPSMKGPGGKPLPVTKRKRSTLGLEDEAVQFGPLGRRCFQTSMALATLTFLGQGTNAAVRTLAFRDNNGQHTWWCGESKTVFLLGAASLYLYLTISLFDWNRSPELVYFVVWCVALIADSVIFVVDALMLSGLQQSGVTSRMSQDPSDKGLNRWDCVDLALSGARVFLLMGMVLVYYAAIVARKRAEREKYLEDYGSDSDETTPLINGSARHRYSATNGHAAHPTTNGSAEGNTNGTTDATHQVVDEEAAFYRPEKLPHTTWYEYLRGYSVFFPYMWPSKQYKLQAIIVFCFFLLIVQRAATVLVPYQISVVTNKLFGVGLAPGETRPMPWLDVGLLILFKTLQMPSGVVGSLRNVLWTPVAQYTYRALTSAAFEHVHSLGLDFHLSKRTGEVLSALNKGNSVNSFLEQVQFQVFPVLVDLLLAIGYIYFQFNAVYAEMVSIDTLFYLSLTVRMAQRTADYRRAMSNADREEEAVKNDSIISYETVKYFNAEQFEFRRYKGAIENFQRAEAQVTWSINWMNVCQAVVFMVGQMVVLMFCAYEIYQGHRQPGDFVGLLTYLSQLQGPLNFFGTFYRTVQQALISAERLLELFKQQPTVVDRPGVKDVDRCDGKVEFDNVRFAYDKRKPALNKLNFVCQPGTTTALVGESGGGKSTLFRLMYRYFNCQEGTIKIDDHNVLDVSIDSIRRYIGVVPQDTVLFNDTLMYNLRYANPDATDQDIYAACEAASIHDRIISFPDGYNTKVGERGLRLSGGEKQRVAIARTLLKNPRIIMLDEATSALDTHTEQEIQSRLAKIGHGRTLLIIAHRLSTITHADQILVLQKGGIIQSGTHESLLAKGGPYADLWSKQAKAQKAADDARDAVKKATKLMKKANFHEADPKGSSQETEGHGSSTHDESSCSSSDESSVVHTGKAANNK